MSCDICIDDYTTIFSKSILNLTLCLSVGVCVPFEIIAWGLGQLAR